MMSAVNRLVSMAVQSNACVLITGPTGSGKTRLANQIHLESSRRANPFVVVNLATLHEGTLESELFGHHRGAFTGADQKRQGLLEAAEGGTVFLDEIGELSPRLQGRLLEFLQSKIIYPVGSSRPIRLNVRIIAATNRDLRTLVKNGQFREDLFYRLRVIEIAMKSLVERGEEMDLLVHECLAEVAALAGRRLYRISEEVAAKFETYSWPGNFRELRNVLEYAVLSSTGGEIGVGDLPQWFHEQHASENLPRGRGNLEVVGGLGVAEVPLSFDYSDTMWRFEREYIRRALERYRGRINHTARMVGINKTTLLRRIRAYGLLQEPAAIPNELEFAEELT